MKLLRKAGSTSEIWQIFIADSSSTAGAGLTGLTNASASLTAYYHRDTDTTATAISLVSMTVGTFTSSGFKEIDATNMPGWYQFCPPNAAIAAGAKSCGFHLKGATNMAPLPIEVDLLGDVNVVSIGGTTQTARDLGASVLLSSGTGAGQLDFTSGVVKANATQFAGQTITCAGGVTIPAATLASTTNITAATGVVLSGVTHTGAVIPTVTTTTTATNLTNLPAITAGWLTATGIAADAITAAKIADGAIDAATFASGALDAVWSTAARTLTAGTNIVLAKGTGITGFNDLSATGVENAVWDATTAAHPTAGSTGAAIIAAGSAGDPWSTTIPGAYGAGTAGKIVGDNLNAAITSRMATYTQPTGFLAATFPAGTIANTTNITAGTITTATTLTNLPSIPANWITSAGINASALNGKGDWNIGKTGYKLASDGLDSVSTTAPSGVAGNYREMGVQLWRRSFKKKTLTIDSPGNYTVKTYADDGSTVLTTQADTDDGTDQVQGAAT